MAGFDFARQPLGEFLERVASSEPAPGGGAAAAVSAALAAGLVGMVARFSEAEVADAPDIRDEADRLREVALGLAPQDAEAYGAVLGALRLPKGSADRPERLRTALEHAADIPLAIAEAAANTAALASRLARDGNANLHGDAVVAVLLADAAARGAAKLVGLNVALGRLEGTWLDRSAACVGATRNAVLAAGGDN